MRNADECRLLDLKNGLKGRKPKNARSVHFSATSSAAGTAKHRRGISSTSTMPSSNRFMKTTTSLKQCESAATIAKSLASKQREAECQDFFKQLFEHVLYLTIQLKTDPKEDKDEARSKDCDESLDKTAAETIAAKVLEVVKPILKKSGVTCETVVREWETSVDPCKSLVSYLMKPSDQAGNALSAAAEEFGGTRTFYTTYSDKNETKAAAKLSLGPGMWVTEGPDESEAQAEAETELQEIRKQIRALERVMIKRGELRTKSEYEWNKCTESYYKAYRKLAKKTANVTGKSQHTWDLICLRNCFLKAPDYLSTGTAPKAARDVLSLEHMRKYLTEREKNLKEMGYFKEEKLGRVLEEIYAEVVKLIVTEKIMHDFNKKMNTTQQRRQHYLEGKNTAHMEKLKRYSEKQKEEEEKASNKKVLQEYSKRFKNLLKGYERNLVTRPKHIRFYDDAKKDNEQIWKPVFLTDQDKKFRGKQDIQEMQSPLELDREEDKTTVLLLTKKHWNKDKARTYTSIGPQDEDPKMSVGILARAALRIQQYYRRFKLRKKARDIRAKQEREREAEKQRKLRELKKNRGKGTAPPPKSPAISEKEESCSNTDAKASVKSGPSNHKSLTCLEFAGFDTTGLDLEHVKAGTLIMKNTDLGKESERKKQSVNFHEAAVKRYKSIKRVALVNNIFSAAKTNAKNYLIKRAQDKSLDPSCLNEKDKHGCTALYYACRNNYPKTARVLLGSGANPNIRNVGGNTALHEAFRNGNPKLVGELLSKGASVSIVNDQKQTPLFFATPTLAKNYGLQDGVTFLGTPMDLCRCATVLPSPRNFAKKGAAVAAANKPKDRTIDPEVQKMIQTYQNLSPFFQPN